MADVDVKHDEDRLDIQDEEGNDEVLAPALLPRLPAHSASL